MGEWNQGRVAHIIPTMNHECFLIKVSFTEAPTNRRSCQ